ncbi:PhoH family protein [Chthoniobacter flavus Ellin428]|uniref:PhoH family protein n=2 Tax=Verrucomicrobiota TaxID=74201 RepID=B4D8X1_9BACT|nr:PhoH family protein [Chthoniobacter flavus]EDY17179.1 PhoH family protein [Chthoniobacter flavus Ellin428]TCO90162.1 PhoH-like ATPase [Chthoniobacter flavus]
MAVKKSDINPTKHYVLDTNVLIHDPQSMFQFEDNVVWIPVEVLEELDRFKSESTTRGANAREVHRRLSERFRTTEQMRAGVKLENGGWLHVYINPALKHEGHDWKLIEESPRSRLALTLFPDLDATDNRILASAAYLADTKADGAILVTKDLNMQLKARALGLDAQDYRTDRVEDNDIRRTQRRSGTEEYAALDIPGHTVQAFASQERIQLPHLEMLLPNQYVLLRNEEEPTHGVPARHIGNGEFVKLRHDHINIRGGRSLQAANLGQRFFLDALYDPAITLVTVYGKAGTGKTLLSVGSALEQVQAGEYEKMLITRVIMPTGRDIGFLPGRMEEKMQPWVQPAYDALDLLLSRPRKPEQFEKKKQSKRKADGSVAAPQQTQNPSGKYARPYEPLMQSGMLEIEAIAHIRGRSLPRAIFIVDEAQQLTPHEAKTLVTRMGKGSKIILIGDLAQIDNPYVDAHTNGLVFTRNRLQGQPFMAHVNLFKGERSEMAEVAANLM